MVFRSSDDVIKELEELQATKEKQRHGLTTLEALRNLKRSDVRTPFLLVLGNFFFVIFSGPVVVIFYAVEIFGEAGIDVDKYFAAVITAGVRVSGNRFIFQISSNFLI